MRKNILLIKMMFCIILIAGCATEQPIQTECTATEYNISTDNVIYQAAYSCPIYIPKDWASTNGCKWVNSYTKKDGSIVNGYYRCNTPYYINSSQISSSNTDAPCVYNTCGPVHVKGYYRKNGTYVRPYTRSRARR